MGADSDTTYQATRVSIVADSAPTTTRLPLPVRTAIEPGVACFSAGVWPCAGGDNARTTADHDIPPAALLAAPLLRLVVLW